MEASRVVFVYVVNILISATELLVALLIPLIGAVLKCQVRKNPFNVIIHHLKEE